MEKFTLKSGNKTSFKEMGAIEADSPAKDYKNRHASIMLILHTIIDGFEKFGENQL